MLLQGQNKLERVGRIEIPEVKTKDTRVAQRSRSTEKANGNGYLIRTKGASKID
jgi:hypothetical protein